MSLQVTDDDGATDVATSSITVASNLPPIANPDGADSDGNPDPICVSTTGTTIAVLANDDDPDNPNDGEDVFLTDFDQGAYGTVTRDSRGTKTLSDDRLTYTSTVDNGLDTFTYTIGDVDGATSSTTVYVDPGVCGNVTVNFQAGGETLPADEAAGGKLQVTYDNEENLDGLDADDVYAAENQASQSFNVPLYQVERVATLLTDLTAGDIAPPDGYEIRQLDPVEKFPDSPDDFPTDPADPDFSPQNFTRSNLGLDFSLNDAPTACFSFIPANPATGESVDFDAACSSDPNGDDTIVSYKWDKNSTTFEEAHRIGEMMTTSFSRSGNHAITLQVTDDAGAIATTSQIVSISDGGGGGSACSIELTDPTGYDNVEDQAKLFPPAGQVTIRLLEVTEHDDGGPVADNIELEVDGRDADSDFEHGYLTPATAAQITLDGEQIYFESIVDDAQDWIVTLQVADCGGSGLSCDESTLIASMSEWDDSICSQSVDGGISSQGGNCSVQAHQWGADTTAIVPHTQSPQSGVPGSQTFTVANGASGNVQLRLQDQEGDWGPWRNEFASCEAS